MRRNSNFIATCKILQFNTKSLPQKCLQARQYFKRNSAEDDCTYSNEPKTYHNKLLICVWSYKFGLTCSHVCCKFLVKEIFTFQDFTTSICKASSWITYISWESSRDVLNNLLGSRWQLFGQIRNRTPAHVRASQPLLLTKASIYHKSTVHSSARNIIFNKFEACILHLLSRNGRCCRKKTSTAIAITVSLVLSVAWMQSHFKKVRPTGCLRAKRKFAELCLCPEFYCADFSSGL